MIAFALRIVQSFREAAPGAGIKICSSTMRGKLKDGMSNAKGKCLAQKMTNEKQVAKDMIPAKRTRSLHRLIFGVCTRHQFHNMLLNRETSLQRQLNIQHEYAHLGSIHDCSPCLGTVRTHHCASQKLGLRGLDTPP